MTVCDMSVNPLASLQAPSDTSLTRVTRDSCYLQAFLFNVLILNTTNKRAIPVTFRAFNGRGMERQIEDFITMTV